MKRAEAKVKRTVPAKTKVAGILKATLTGGGRLLSDAKPSPSLDVAETSGVLNPGVMQYAKVLAHAVDTFGSRTRANSWLNRPSRIFNNQSPLQVLTQDPAAVEEELVRIDHGMFL